MDVSTVVEPLPSFDDERDVPPNKAEARGGLPDSNVVNGEYGIVDSDNKFQSAISAWRRES